MGIFYAHGCSQLSHPNLCRAHMFSSCSVRTEHGGRATARGYPCGRPDPEHTAGSGFGTVLHLTLCQNEVKAWAPPGLTPMQGSLQHGGWAKGWLLYPRGLLASLPPSLALVAGGFHVENPKASPAGPVVSCPITVSTGRHHSAREGHVEGFWGSQPRVEVEASLWGRGGRRRDEPHEATPAPAGHGGAHGSGCQLRLGTAWK